MRLFRVVGEWGDNGPSPDERCMRIEHGEEGPAVYMEDHILPVSKSLGAPFLERVPLQALPLGAANVNVGETTRLFQASRDELERVRRGSYYGSALVHVCPPRRTECPVQFLASCYGEKVVSYRSGPRVERDYLPLGDAGGVRALVMSDDSQEALIEMLPGSSFRLQRDEHRVEDGESPVLVVSWSGKELRVFRPRRFKDGRPKKKPYHSRRPRPRRVSGGARDAAAG